ncbi:DUF3987 domain-containing protein [Providencia stuartii]
MEQGQQVITTFTANEEAISLWYQYCTELQDEIKPRGQWEHIRDSVLKASSNTLRLAAILQFIHDDRDSILTAHSLKCAISIINWHLQKTSHILYSQSSRYLFEQDARDLARWIWNKASKNNWQPFLKRELQTHGPHRLRRLDKLERLLNQLIAQKVIVTVRNAQGGPLYVVPIPPNGRYIISQASQLTIHQNANNTKGLYEHVNLENLI